MARYALIEEKTGLVVNAIEWDGKAEYDPGSGFMLERSDAAAVGDTKVGDAFIADITGTGTVK